MAKGKKRPKKKTGSDKTDLQKAYQNQWKRINSNIQKLEKQGFTVDKSFLPRQLSHPRWASVEALRSIKMRNIRSQATVTVGETEFKASDIYYERRRQKFERKRQQKAKQKAQSAKDVYSDNTGSILGTDDKTVGVQSTPIVRPVEEYEVDTPSSTEQYEYNTGTDWLGLGEEEYVALEGEKVIPSTDLYPTTQALLRGAKFERNEYGEDVIVTPKGERFFKGEDGKWYTKVAEKPSFIGNTVNLLDDLLPSNDYFTKAKRQNAFHQHATQRLKEVRRLIEMARKRVSEGEPEILNNISENFEEIDKTINGLIYTSDAEGVQDMRYSRLYELIFGEKLDAIAALALGDDEDYYDYLDGDDE